MGGIITREQIEQRKETLCEQRDQALATVNAIIGAIQDCEYWLLLLTPRSQEGQEGDTR